MAHSGSTPTRLAASFCCLSTASPFLTHKKLSTLRWVAPVGFLLDSGFLPTINTDFSKHNDLESVLTFFARVCAPGNEADSRACSACAGNCSMQEPFAGDAGGGHQMSNSLIFLHLL